jgi:hypothetical protein
MRTLITMELNVELVKIEGLGKIVVLEKKEGLVKSVEKYLHLVMKEPSEEGVKTEGLEGIGENLKTYCLWCDLNIILIIDL